MAKNNKDDAPTRELTREDKLTLEVKAAGNPDDRITVKVIKKGYIGHRIVRPDDPKRSVIAIKRSEFSGYWMRLTKKKLVEDLDDEDEATEDGAKASDEAVL